MPERAPGVAWSVVEVFAGRGDSSIAEAVRALAPDAPGIEIEGGPFVLANLTALRSRKGLAVHVLNYGPEPLAELRLRVRLGRKLAAFAAAAPRLVTPDSVTRLRNATRAATGLELTLERLDTYSVIVLE